MLPQFPKLTLRSLVTRLFVGLTFFVYVGDPTISLAFVYIASFVSFPSINSWVDQVFYRLTQCSESPFV